MLCGSLNFSLCTKRRLIFYYKGAYAAPLYPRRRVRPGAMWRWRVSVSGWVRQAVFWRNFRFVLPLFCGMTKQIFRQTSPQLGYCRVLLTQNTIPQTPQFFIFKKIISLSTLNGNRALLKITVQNDKKISYFLVFSVDIFNFWYTFSWE